jgi:long-chain acyl-CoA synthetase
VRGPNVMRGYLGKPEETAQTLRGGWLHSGDLGRFDEDGYLVLIDRIKDMIIRGGENIYPKEIEDALYGHPAVLEAAVVGQPDPVFGEEPVAFVVLRPGLDAEPDELIEHCQSMLAKFKVPRAVFIETDLPKTSIGKVAKPPLRERVSSPTWKRHDVHPAWTAFVGPVRFPRETAVAATATAGWPPKSVSVADQ